MQQSQPFPETIVQIVQVIFTSYKKEMDNSWADAISSCLCNVDQDTLASKKYLTLLLQFTQWLIKLDNASLAAIGRVKSVLPRLPAGFLKAALEKALAPLH